MEAGASARDEPDDGSAPVVAAGSATAEGGLRHRHSAQGSRIGSQAARRRVTVLPPITRPASAERSERVVGALAAPLLAPVEGGPAREQRKHTGVMAEADGNRTRQGRVSPLTGFEDLNSRANAASGDKGSSSGNNATQRER